MVFENERDSPKIKYKQDFETLHLDSKPHERSILPGHVGTICHFENTGCSKYCSAGWFTSLMVLGYPPKFKRTFPKPLDKTNSTVAPASSLSWYHSAHMIYLLFWGFIEDIGFQINKVKSVLERRQQKLRQPFSGLTRKFGKRIGETRPPPSCRSVTKSTNHLGEIF